MEIFLTNKLIELVTPTKIISDANSHQKWSAHLFVLGRKKNIIFTHKETLYSFFVLEVSKKDINTLPQRILYELQIQLKVDNFDAVKALIYFGASTLSNVEYLKTDNDQKTLGWIKDQIQVNQLIYEDFKQNPIISSAYFARNEMNNRLVGSREYQSPAQMLQAKLALKIV